MTELQREVRSTVQKLPSTFSWQVSCVMKKVIPAHQHHTFWSSDSLPLLHHHIQRPCTSQPHPCSLGHGLTANLKVKASKLKMAQVSEPAWGYFQTNQSSSRFLKSVDSSSMAKIPLSKASCIFSFWAEIVKMKLVECSL